MPRSPGLDEKTIEDLGLLNRYSTPFSVGDESAGEWLELENTVHNCDLRLKDQLSAMAGFCLQRRGREEFVRRGQAKRGGVRRFW